MEKRKLKLNILDITIIALLICTVVAIVFRGTVKESFDKPEILTLKVVVAADIENEAVQEIFKLYNTVYIDGNTQLQSAVISSEEKENQRIAVLECKGYKKLGRLYTEHGDLLSNVTQCTVQYGDMRVRCTIQSVEMAD